MNAPERIYLCASGDDPDADCDDLDPEQVMWCEDAQGEHDVEYVRADIVADHYVERPVYNSAWARVDRLEAERAEYENACVEASTEIWKLAVAERDELRAEVKALRVKLGIIVLATGVEQNGTS